MTIISTKVTNDVKPVYLDYTRAPLTFIKYRGNAPTVAFIIDTKPNRYGVVAVAKIGKEREKQFHSAEEIADFIQWLSQAGFCKQQADFSDTIYDLAWMPTPPQQIIATEPCHRHTQSQVSSDITSFDSDIVLSL